MKPSASYDAVVAGHVCLDIIPKLSHAGSGNVADIFVPGKLLNIESTALSTGGAVSNAGLPLIKLGMKTALMGKISNDVFGNGIRAIFEKWKAGDALTVVENEQSSYTVVLAPPGIDRIFFHHPGANDTFCAKDINYGLVARARLFHLGYPPLMRGLFANGGKETATIFRKVKELGVTTSLDMALPDPASPAGKADWHRILDAVLPYVDIAPFSAEEATFMLDRKRFDAIKKTAAGRDPVECYTPDDFLHIAHELLRRGVRVVVLKCGMRGILLVTGSEKAVAGMGAAAPAKPAEWANRVLWHEPFYVEKVVSAAGSGDNAIAGFLAAFLRGSSPEQALAVACCTGAQNVLVPDAVSGVHTWKETMAMMPGWKLRRQDPGKGWTYNSRLRIWKGSRDGA